MTGMAVGNCSRCGAAASYFAPSCPNCHASQPAQPGCRNRGAGGGALGRRPDCARLVALRGDVELEARPSRRAGRPQATIAAKADYGWLITSAMAECEAEAKVQADMRFPIVPVTATGISLPGWSPPVIGTTGDAVTLLHSTDTLVGLRNGALALYPARDVRAVRPCEQDRIQ